MSATPELNRLRWRCRRGMRELDTLLTSYLDRDYAAASASEQAAFQDLLSRPDPEILGLLVGRLRCEDPVLDRVVTSVREQRLPRGSADQG